MSVWTASWYIDVVLSVLAVLIFSIVILYVYSVVTKPGADTQETSEDE